MGGRSNLNLLQAGSADAAGDFSMFPGLAPAIIREVGR